MRPMGSGGRDAATTAARMAALRIYTNQDATEEFTGITGCTKDNLRNWDHEITRRNTKKTAKNTKNKLDQVAVILDRDVVKK